MASMISISLDEVILEFQDFVAFVAAPQASNHPIEVELLTRIDNLVVAARNIDDFFEKKLLVFDNHEYSNLEFENLELVRKAIAEKFPNLGFYNDIGNMHENIGSPEFSVGDGIDDVLDIFIDISRSLQRIQKNSIADGLWHCLLLYNAHWSFHARSLQRLLHEICSE